MSEDFLPRPNAPNLFKSLDDPRSIYTWYDPGRNHKPITNPTIQYLSPSDDRLARYGVLRLKEIEGEDAINPNNWFHPSVGLVVFKRVAYQAFSKYIENLSTSDHLNYCLDEGVFAQWMSRLFREGRVNIRRLPDQWFNLPALTRAGRYDFGPVEDSFSVQYVHCKLQRQSDPRLPKLVERLCFRRGYRARIAMRSISASVTV